MSDEHPKDYASPACMAAEVAPDYFDPLAVDPVAAADAARWRKGVRAQLLAARAARDAAVTDAAIADHLDRVLADRFGGAEGMILAAYWPIRGEPDLRPWMARQTGLRLALPVVVAPDQPLIFRPWSPDAPMRPGRWNIPEPDTDAQVLGDYYATVLHGLSVQARDGVSRKRLMATIPIALLAIQAASS